MMADLSFKLDPGAIDDAICWIGGDDHFDFIPVIGSISDLSPAPTCMLMLHPQHLKLACKLLVQWDGNVRAMAETGGFFEIELVSRDTLDADDGQKNIFLDTRCKLEEGTHYLLDYDSSVRRLRIVVNMGIAGRYATSEWFELTDRVHDECARSAMQARPRIVELRTH